MKPNIVRPTILGAHMHRSAVGSKRISKDYAVCSGSFVLFSNHILCQNCPQVDLMRSFIFRNSTKTYNGLPVMAANMDTVGTFEMAKALASVSKSRENS